MTVPEMVLTVGFVLLIIALWRQESLLEMYRDHEHYEESTQRSRLNGYSNGFRNGNVRPKSRFRSWVKW
jgi:hypothetical protein